MDAELNKNAFLFELKTDGGEADEYHGVNGSGLKDGTLVELYALDESDPEYHPNTAAEFGPIRTILPEWQYGMNDWTRFPSYFFPTQLKPVTKAARELLKAYKS